MFEAIPECIGRPIFEDEYLDEKKEMIIRGFEDYVYTTTDIFEL